MQRVEGLGDFVPTGLYLEPSGVAGLYELRHTDRDIYDSWPWQLKAKLISRSRWESLLASAVAKDNQVTAHPRAA